METMEERIRILRKGLEDLTDYAQRMEDCGAIKAADTARLNAKAVRMTLDNLRCFDCGETAEECRYQWDRVWGTNY